MSSPLIGETRQGWVGSCGPSDYKGCILARAPSVKAVPQQGSPVVLGSVGDWQWRVESWDLWRDKGSSSIVEQC